eukprot:RCo004490
MSEGREEYLKRAGVPNLVEAFLEDLTQARPQDVSHFLAEWAMKRLSEPQRQKVLEALASAGPAGTVPGSQPKRQVKHKLLVIAGPSGVGKGTLIKELMTDNPTGFGFSVSHTTRYPRPGETCGKDYHFVPKEAFEKLIAEQAFVEFASVHDNFYGTSKASIEKVWEKGQCCILDIDVQGTQTVHRSGMPAFKIFVKPPSHEELARRLRGRGTEAPEKVERRLANALGELQVAERNEGGLFDLFIVNDDLATAVEDLKRAVYVAP